jgi:dTDP-4-dehydrorhamnose 3,5-epimerase
MTAAATLEPMAIDGAWVFTPRQFNDDRGTSMEWFRQDLLEDKTGQPMNTRQINCAVSRAGVIRGIHYAEPPPGQAKYVMCPVGAVFDVVVDLRQGSPTFGQWDSVILDDSSHRAVYLAEGLGHAVMSLEDGSVIVYLCSTEYAPTRERSIHPLDPDIAIAWPSRGRAGKRLTTYLSTRDSEAPSFRGLESARLFPIYGHGLSRSRKCIDSNTGRS